VIDPWKEKSFEAAYFQDLETLSHICISVLHISPPFCFLMSCHYTVFRSPSILITGYQPATPSSPPFITSSSRTFFIKRNLPAPALWQHKPSLDHHNHQPPHPSRSHHLLRPRKHYAARCIYDLRQNRCRRTYCHRLQTGGRCPLSW
jgi:hypothetical protein